MPALDKRVSAVAKTNTNILANAGTKHSTAGNLTVKYTDAKGRSFNAKSLGPGTSSGLKLRIDGLTNAARPILDNVPAKTSLNQTNCYSART